MLKTDKVPGRLRNRPLKNYTGMRFGRLVAISLVARDPTKENNHKWLFKCDCGREYTGGIKLVRGGQTSSCGCLASEVLSARNTTHGLSQKYKATYRSWKDMRARCRNPNDTDFGNYGGRGITICERWDDFVNFFSDMGERPEGLTLDRIDVNGNYEPLNCQWADADTQANNKRSNFPVTYKGETKNLQQWCRELNLDHSKVRYRLLQGWSLEAAFSEEDFRKWPS